MVILCTVNHLKLPLCLSQVRSSWGAAVSWWLCGFTDCSFCSALVWYWAFPEGGSTRVEASWLYCSSGLHWRVQPVLWLLWWQTEQHLCRGENWRTLPVKNLGVPFRQVHPLRVPQKRMAKSRLVVWCHESGAQWSFASLSLPLEAKLCSRVKLN